jgi:chromosomal replication initiator protein
LSSRFAGGLTVDIGEPDLELKTAILKKKAEKFGYELPIDVGLFIAEKVADTRSLEGLLLRVITQATTNQQPISLELAQQALGGGAAPAEKKGGRIRAEDVIDQTCNYFHIKQTQLRGQKREAFLVRARQIAMYILYVKLGITYVQIGNILGGRDHTTVMHGVDKMTTLVDNKDGVYGDIEGIIKLLDG